jgi:carboxypeptidase family protein
MSALLAILWLLVVDALAPASATARAQLPNVTEDVGVTGYVLAPDGTPVSSGTVAASGVGRTTAAIDRTGHFRLISGSGRQQVTVTVPNLTPYRFSLTVPASRSLRLPVIRLSPAAYFRVRFVSPAGELITAPQIRRRSFDVSGNSIADGLDERFLNTADNDGAFAIGPLSRGIMALAVDNPLFAQTRLPDVKFDGVPKDIDGGTIVIEQPGAVLHVDLVDDTGAPVPDHLVTLEDALPRSPLVFRPVRTNRQGRATFERLAAGRYSVSTSASGPCGIQPPMPVTQVLAMPGSGAVATRLIVGVRATFRFTSPLGPIKGVLISASPNAQPSPPPFGSRSSGAACRGTTDTDGRVTLTNFPPGPAHVDVPMGYSTFVRQVDVPRDGREMAVVVPDGFLAVRAVNALKNQPVIGATITWSGGGSRVEATATTTGEALLGGVGTAGGTLAVSARGFDAVEEQLAEPPGVLHDVALVPAATAANLRPRVITTSGEPLPNAVVELLSANPAAVPQVAVTNANGVVAFSDVPSGSLQLTASADGFVTSWLRVGEERTAEIALTLSPGYRVIASVEATGAEGPQVIRVVNDAGRSVEELLDSASDRGIEPPGRLSLGLLAAGAYAIELYGARGRRQERIRIVDRDVYIAIK